MLRSASTYPSGEPTLDELRMPPELRGAFALVFMSFMCGVALFTALVFVALFGAMVLPLLLVFPLLGVAMACGAIVAGTAGFRRGGDHSRPLAGFVLVLAGTEVVAWLSLIGLPVFLLLFLHF